MVHLMTVIEVFFCFKQKTAYEMRISDWSSDVCSSDLERGRDTECGNRVRVLNLAAVMAPSIAAASLVVLVVFRDQALASVFDAVRTRYIEIGRASCRERVCQYG